MRLILTRRTAETLTGCTSGVEVPLYDESKYSKSGVEVEFFIFEAKIVKLSWFELYASGDPVGLMTPFLSVVATRKYRI